MNFWRYSNAAKMLAPAFLDLYFIASILILSKKPQYSIFQIITLFPSPFSKTIEGPLYFLQLESLKTTKWFKKIKWKLTRTNFRFFYLTKESRITKQGSPNRRTKHKSGSLSWITRYKTDDKLSFNLHIGKILQQVS